MLMGLGPQLLGFSEAMLIYTNIMHPKERVKTYSSFFLPVFAFSRSVLQLCGCIVYI